MKLSPTFLKHTGILKLLDQINSSYQFFFLLLFPLKPLKNKLRTPQQINEIKQAGEPWLNITWMVSNNCNYRCSYCTEEYWEGTNRNENFEECKQGLNAIIEHAVNLKKTRIFLFFTGGEPTLWPPLAEAVEYFKKNATKNNITLYIGINTNLSSSKEWWKENIHLFDLVCASFHPHFANKEKFIENCKTIQDDTSLALRLMLDEIHFNSIKQLYKIAKKDLINFSVEFVPLFDTLSENAKLIKYDKKIEKFLKKHRLNEFFGNRKQKSSGIKLITIGSNGKLYDFSSNALIVNKKNCFKGWNCEIQSQISIDMHQDITHANCRSLPSVGNLQDPQIKFREKNFICKKDICHCGSDLLIPKKRDL